MSGTTVARPASTDHAPDSPGAATRPFVLHRPLVRLAAALAAVLLATLLTATVPVLRDRFTFFAFWPTCLLVSWYAGFGPGLLATLLSAVAVLLLLPSPGQLVAPGSELVVVLLAFTAVGGSGALLAYWRERSERAVHETRVRLDVMANSAPVLLWMTDAGGAATYFNRPWVAFTGRTLAQDRGAGWLEAVHPDDRARCARQWGEAFAARRDFEMRFRLRRRDGEYRMLLNRGVPHYATDGTFCGFVGSCIDVTEQQRAFEQVEAARGAAETASRAKDAFLATISHELRAPLSPILAWTRMLRDGALSAEQTTRAVEVIERNARSQAQLVEDLLDVSRIVAGKLRLHVRPVPLARIIENAMETVRAGAEAKNVHLHTLVESGVPAVAGDPDRLQQVVWNLLSNAVKFTPRGGRVQVTLARAGADVEIAVSDTGIGIPADQLPHIFERFWQADGSPSRSHGGLGLGLGIVRHLVELHGGTVHCASAGTGQGSTFTVVLPVLAATQRDDAAVRRDPAAREPAAAAPVTRLDEVRVLLVDDDPDANEAVRLLLDHCGADVRVAASAAQAFEILGRWRPDVLVSDIGMPGEDGYALIRRLRARTDAIGRLPAVALTAYASVDDRIRLLASGFQLHVAKPSDPAELTAAVLAAARRGTAEEPVTSDR